MWEKLKPLLLDDGLFMAVVLLLVGVASFGLGRMSVVEPEGGAAATAVYIPAPIQAPVAIEQAEQSLPTSAVAVVASKNGTRYHLLECPGAGQIHKENRIEFASIAAAAAAGYTPAANCPGLQ